MASSYTTAFEHIPRTRQGHFLLHFYAAVHHLIRYIGRMQQLVGKELAESLTQYPFVTKYLAEIDRVVPSGISDEAVTAWWEHEITTWERAVQEHLPLRAVDTLPGTGFVDRLTLMCVSLVEEDSRLGTLFAKYQEPLSYRRPCLETVGQILSPSQHGGRDAWSLCRPLTRAGLIEVVNHDAPRAEWVLRVPVLLWSVLRDTLETQPAHWCQLYPPEHLPAIDELIFPKEFLQRLSRIPTMVENGRVGALIIRGMQGSERLDVLGAIVRTRGWGAIEYLPNTSNREGGGLEEQQYKLLGPLCTLARCIPVLTSDLGPGETVALQPFSGHQGPLGVLMGQEGGLRGPLAEKALTLTLPPAGVAERLRHWQRTLDGHVVPDLPTISERFRIPGGYICQAGAQAVTQAALEQRQTITVGDVRAACRGLNRQLLDSLATHLKCTDTWDHLVVNEMTGVKLHELELRCRHRETLLEHLGPAFQATTGSGVRTLFTGISGTGKTLAAKILAAELEMDLYRVDLSAVINKYIGETEKNLHRVLSRAEELDVILLLDEGDALMGNRTEVKSSNDRYANLETDYLLQRLENYLGIVVVTTNASQNIDQAFQRRMDVVVDFTAPQAPERLRIWQLHLPSDHNLVPDYLDRIATRHVLTGGQIRNAALHATLLALDESSRSIVRPYHIETAIESEYRKAGALFSVLEGVPDRQPQAMMASLLETLSQQSDTLSSERSPHPERQGGDDGEGIWIPGG